MADSKLLSPRISIHFLGWGVIVFFFLSWAMGASYWDFRASRSQKTLLEGLMKQVNQLDQLISSYVRSAATVGDVELETYYLESTLQRENIMSQLKELFPRVFDLREVMDMIAAKEAMTGLETQAFEFVRDKKLDLADSLVFDRTYEEKNAEYTEGFGGFEDKLRNEAEADYLSKRNKILWVAGAGLFLIPFFACWHFFWTKKLKFFYAKYGRAIKINR